MVITVVMEFPIIQLLNLNEAHSGFVYPFNRTGWSTHRVNRRGAAERLQLETPSLDLEAESIELFQNAEEKGQDCISP
jgi:hypothetical protein